VAPTARSSVGTGPSARPAFLRTGSWSAPADAAFDLSVASRPPLNAVGPGVLRRLPQRRETTVATFITADCISCGACEPECPNRAIREDDDRYVIDPALCTECVGYYPEEACQAVCPVECCVRDPEHLESEPLLLERALSLHPDPPSLRRAIQDNSLVSRFRK
jgi:ferredoxin